jgi:hypothetical protein
MDPVYLVTNRFRRTSLSMSSTAHGLSLAEGIMRIKRALAGQADGSSETGGAARVKHLMGSVVAGNAACAGDATVIHPTVYHVLVTGQSNGYGAAILGNDLTPAPGGRMFNAGVIPGGTGLTSIVQLVDNAIQTVAPTLAARLAAEIGHGLVLVSNVAVPSAIYTALKKGTSPYNDSLAQVTAAKNLTLGSGLTYRFLGVCVVHGETDDVNNNSNYAANVIEWATDYDTDIRAITGQAETVPLFFVQHSHNRFDAQSRTPPLYAGSTSIGLFDAAVAQPTKVKLAGPQYMYDKTDSIHHTCAARRAQGEMFATQIHRDLIANTFAPFIPLSATLTSAVIDVVFQVPVPPLDFNFTDVVFRKNYGFAYWDANGFGTILDTVILNPTTIRITLSAAPSGANKRLMYAGFPQTTAAIESKYFGPHGNLVDSDTFASLRGYNLVNFCPHFNIPVT